jgi:peptidoglycan/xylan/chitin deacetylase (PgdA/CDA1 family)
MPLSKPRNKYLDLFQNFSFWNSFLRFNGKTGLKRLSKTNRVLEQAHFALVFPPLLFFMLTFSAGADVLFSGPDLAGDNRLLVKAEFSGYSNTTESVLFLAKIPGPDIRPLTVFPESMELLENGRTLQLRNAAGTYRVPVSGGLPAEIPGLGSFASGGAAGVPGGRMENMAVSADGKQILYIEKAGAAYGNLKLLNLNSGIVKDVARHVERPDRIFPASWSPDSHVFVYASGGRLYYYAVNAAPVDERFRLMGDGEINSIFWGRGGDLYYLKNSTVYRVRQADLFARALYVEFLDIGSTAGKIPFEFNPVFDRFWIAPDGRSLLVSRGGRNIFYFPLNFDDYSDTGNASLPYLAIPRSSMDVRVLWSPGGAITIAASVPGGKNGKRETLAWRLKAEEGASVFVPLSLPGSHRGALSPDGTKALFWGEKGAVIYDYINWKPVVTLGSRPVFSGLWNGNDEVLVGDDRKIERLRLNPKAENGAAIAERNLVCLSEAHIFGFEDGGSESPGRILARSGDDWFATDGESPWTGVLNPPMRLSSPASGSYRVFLEKQNGRPFLNLPMIRNVLSSGTFPLFQEAKNVQAKRPLALCFDLYDDAEGLPETLDALERYGVKATFFLGGEFIRRYPAAAVDIAAQGHEMASLFFAAIDLSDTRYRIAGDFIARGLARNEDEFYKAVSGSHAEGAELALLWHPPYFASSGEIEAAAAASGYVTVKADVDPLDWVSREDEKRFSLSQESAADMIDGIMEAVKAGSIVPIRLGLLPGGRRDYLFNRLNVLLDALVQDGYAPVIVSEILRK